MKKTMTRKEGHYGAGDVFWPLMAGKTRGRGKAKSLDEEGEKKKSEKADESGIMSEKGRFLRLHQKEK